MFFSFCILVDMPMGGAIAPPRPPPWLRYCSHVRKINRNRKLLFYCLKYPNYFLGCPASGPIRKPLFRSSLYKFNQWSKARGVVLLLVLRVVSPRRHPSEGVGHHHHNLLQIKTPLSTKTKEWLCCFFFNSIIFAECILTTWRSTLILA